jgi:hypothetical protein
MLTSTGMVKVLVIDKVFSMFLESAEKQEGGGAHGFLASGGSGSRRRHYQDAAAEITLICRC